MSRESRQRSAIGTYMTPVSPVTDEPGGAEGRGELRGRDQLVVAVGAARQPAQDVFGADDGEEPRLHRAVDRGGDHHPAGLQDRRTGGDEGRHVGDVLDHLQDRDDVEALGPLRLFFDRDGAVVDRQTGLLGMMARRPLTFSGAGSIPVTVAPMRQSGSVTRPPPQPTSRTVSPAAHGGLSGRDRTSRRSRP